MTKPKTTPPSKNQQIRVLVCQGLKQVLQESKSLNVVLQQLPDALSMENRASVQDGLYGVLRHYPSLAAQIKPLLARPFKNKDIELLYLLCFALYQLCVQHKPAHAVVDEAVAAVTPLGKPWAKGVVNAILRQCTSNNQSTLPCVDFDHPTWWITQLQQDWLDDWQAILTANNQHAPLTLRINPEKTDVTTYIDKLAAQSIAAQKHEIAPHAIELTEPCRVQILPDFHQGAVIVQDASAQLAAPLLELTPGLKVLDACAAPGGKTCHILNLAPDLIVTALEYDPIRAERIEDNLQRMQQHARIIIGDASAPTAWWDGDLFDRILCDVPCSASGIIRRHPDIKFLRHETDISELANTQLAILQALWSLLVPDGILVYTTCSILRAENDAVIATWLATVDNAELVDLPEYLGIKTVYGRQRLPGQFNMDGFYYAKLRKQRSC